MTHMRTVFVLFIALIQLAQADSTADCKQIAAGAFPNNATEVQNLELISYADHFSLTNMLAMRIDLGREKITFNREYLRSDAQSTKAGFIIRKSSSEVRQAWLQLDRTPRKAIEDRSFKVILFLSKSLNKRVDLPATISSQEIATLNLECSF